MNYQQLILRAGTVTPTDTVIGVLGIVMIIEAARRIVGLPIVIVVCCFLAYGFFGPYLPGPLAHRGLTIKQMVGHLFFTTEGVFGIPMGVSSTFIFLFILFGAYLERRVLGNSSSISPMPSLAGHPADRLRSLSFPRLCRVRSPVPR